MRETIEEFQYKGRIFQVDGCWDGETPEGEYDFYELWEAGDWGVGICLTEGSDPFYDRPSREELIETIDEYDRLHTV